jgi:hypothetical protein
MNIGSIMTSTGYQSGALVSARPVEPASAAPEAKSAAAPTKAKPLFSGGLTNWNTIMTPDTLRAIFTLDEHGEVKFDSNGLPVWAPDGDMETPIAPLLFDHLKDIHAQETGIRAFATDPNPRYRVSATDEQKRFFYAVTGYNLVTEDGGYGVYDDSGKLLPNVATGNGVGLPEWQLAWDIVYTNFEIDGVPCNPDGSPRTGQTSLDGDWFQKWIEKMAICKADIPESWLSRAKAYFEKAKQAQSDEVKDQPLQKAASH